MKPQRYTTRIRRSTRHPITRMHTLTIQPKPALKSAPTVRSAPRTAATNSLPNSKTPSRAAWTSHGGTPTGARACGFPRKSTGSEAGGARAVGKSHRWRVLCVLAGRFYGRRACLFQVWVKDGQQERGVNDGLAHAPESIIPLLCGLSGYWLPSPYWAC